MADESTEPIIKMYMDGTGKMSWDVPKDGGVVSRRQVYELLGMVRYADEVLKDMLKQPPQTKE